MRTVGVDLGPLGDTERRRLRRTSLGFVFQELELLDYLDTLDNILVPLWIGRGPGPEDRERARGLAGELGLGTMLHRRPRELSQGERQRVAIARALGDAAAAAPVRRADGQPRPGTPRPRPST